MGLLYTDRSVRTITNTKINNTLKINACSGGIYKTYKESWFTRFDLNSPLAQTLFKPYDNNIKIAPDTIELVRGYIEHRIEHEEPVIVLQMVISGDNSVIAELIREKDFNKYFEVDSLSESYDVPEQKKSDRELLMDELAVAKKILSEPYANIQLGTISGIVKQIIDHTSIESIGAEATRIGYVISSWENALLNGYEDSIILERGYEVTDRTRVLIIYKLISGDLLSGIKKYDDSQDKDHQPTKAYSK